MHPDHQQQPDLLSTIIIPAIMPTSFKDLQMKAGLVHGAVNRIQIDVMDGIFVQSLSWPFIKPSKGVIMKDEDRAHEPDHLDGHFRELQAEEKGLPFWEDIDYDADLMVENPAKAVSEWARIGINRAILHLREENVNDISVAIQVAKEYLLEISLAILPQPLSPALREFIFEKHLEDISGIQCMGISNIGYQRQQFVPKVVDLIHELSHELEKKNEIRTQDGLAPKDLEISVDGGVNHENARPLYDAGADKLISGSTLFDADSPRQAIEFFEDVLM